MADVPNTVSDNSRRAVVDAHQAIEKIRQENAELHAQLVGAQKELYSTHKALEQAHRDLRVAQDFTIQLTQRIERTGR